MKILIVDDDIYVNKMVEKVLEGEKYEVVCAFNGIEAMKKLEADDTIEMIITDIIMPEKEGIELIIEICDKYNDKKIIAMSGGGKIKADSYLLLAKRLGANAVIEKPFDNEDLLQIVKEVLAD